MKERNGFVSNSSSSSFIIAAKEGQTKCRITIDIDLADFREEKITTNNLIYNSDLLHDLIDDGYITEEELGKLFADGYTVYSGILSDEVDLIEALLCERGIRSTDFQGKIIYNKGRY